MYPLLGKYVLALSWADGFLEGQEVQCLLWDGSSAGGDLEGDLAQLSAEHEGTVPGIRGHCPEGTATTGGQDAAL